MRVIRVVFGPGASVWRLVFFAGISFKPCCAIDTFPFFLNVAARCARQVLVA
jgi:hypothetical protein